MKKWIAGILVVIALAAGSTYIFIPSVIHLSSSVSVNAPSRAVLRNEYENAEWEKWWPGTVSGPGKAGGLMTSYNYKEGSYTLSDKKTSAINLAVTFDGMDAVSTVNYVPQSLTQTDIVWTSEVATSANPITRFSIWLKSGKLKENTGELLEKLKTFYLEPLNIYGMEVQIEHLADTLLVSTADTSAAYPTDEQINRLIAKLRNHIDQYGVKETGKPMLNLTSSANRDRWLIRVGLPVAKRIPVSGDIVYKLMPPAVQMMTASVKGGQHTADKALETVGFYATDRNYKLPAIPFFSLVTDRSTEPDTTKWLTKIFYPIML